MNIPQPLVGRMPQLAVICPGAILDLRDQSRLGPRNVLMTTVVFDCRPLGRELVQSRAELNRVFVLETRTNGADVSKSLRAHAPIFSQALGLSLIRGNPGAHSFFATFLEVRHIYDSVTLR